MNIFGIPLAQTPSQIASLFDDIEKFDIKLFVELGIYKGGLSQIMLYRQTCMPDFKYYGYDNDPTQIHGEIFKRPQIRIADVFVQGVVAEVSNLVKSTAGTAMIFCDDGNKQKEMNVYYSVLRSGDFLLAHDVSCKHWSSSDLICFKMIS